MAEWWEAAPLAPADTSATGETPWWQAAPETSFSERFQGRQPGPLIPSQAPDQGSFLPLRRSAKGLEFDPTAGVLGSLWRAITSPGDVATGRLPTPYSSGSDAQPSPDVLSRAAETASLLASPSPSYQAGARYGAPPSTRLPKPPSAQVIRDAANTQYSSVTRSGWEVPSASVETVANQAKRELGPDFTPPGIGGPGDAPRTYGRLEAMANPEYSATSIAGLKAHYDSLTSTISKGGADAKAAYAVREKVAGMINDLEGFGGRPQPGVTPTMTPVEVASTFDAARGNYRAALGANRISGDLDDAVKGILKEVELGQNVKGTGYNVDFQLRNRAGAILKNNANVASLHPDEKAALEAVANGTITRNAVRNFGEAFGWGNPLRAGVGAGVGGGAGTLIGGPIGGGIGAAVLPTLGTGARIVGSGMTKRALGAAEELMRSNSPLAKDILKDLLIQPPAVGRDVIMQQLYRGLLTPPPDRSRLPPGYI